MITRWLRSRAVASMLFVTTACATVPAPPAKVAPRALTQADRAPAGQGLLLVDVTNADTSVHADHKGPMCQTPCVLTLTPGGHRLLFEYEWEGRKVSDEALVEVSGAPQVYRRTVREVHVRSRPGRITGIALWAVGQAAMFTAFVLFAADDSDAVRMARRGLGYGGLGANAVMFPIALLSVRRTRGVGVQFPWSAPSAASMPESGAAAR